MFFADVFLMHTVILKFHLFIVQISLYNILYKNIVI